MNCCFFFSYATGTDPVATQHKREFFDDLSSAVKNHRDYDQGFAEVGFLDADISTGSEWKPRVVAALTTCRAFVYLQEVAYFNFAERPWCGREWRVFRNRLEEHARSISAGAERLPLMIPIVWTQMTNLPPSVADIQFRQREFGEMYSNLDLFRLKSRQENNAAYIQFLATVANHIVDVVKTHQLAPATGLPKFTDIADPFSTAAALPPSNQTKVGLRYVDFVYVVEERDRLRPFRTRLESYDDTDDPKFWKPYYPPDQSAVALLAEQAAYQQRFMPARIECGPGLLAHLDRSEGAQHMVVLIVDPWSLMVNACRTLMENFWKSRYWNAIILIPRHTDEEANRRAQDLSDLIDDVFFGWHADDLRTGIHSPEEFIANLEAAFLSVQKKFLKKAKFRAVEGAGLRMVPGLSAVGI